MVVLVDDAGTPIGTAPRLQVHTEETPLHLAFSSYLFDAEGRLLLTRRALGKKTWPGVWTNSCCGHWLPGEEATDAVRRRVHEELGITIDRLIPVLSDFRYRAVDYSGIVENEICPVFVGTFTGELQPDPDEVMDHCWVEWSELVAMVDATPRLISPWAASQVPQIAELVPDPSGLALGPSTPTPTVTETLTRVEGVLGAEAENLGRIWRRSMAEEDLDVLTEDLPWWLRRLVQDGGKQLRPMMCHWGFVAAGGRAGTAGHDHVVRIGAALEILHTFALIHDDVMDDSDTRRGKPSAHVHAAGLHREADADGDPVTFGANMAILLGDLAHIEADRLINDLPAPLRELWYELSIELIAGQRADLTGAAGRRRDLAHAEAIARLKSGAYTIQRPLLLGAAAAGAGGAAVAALTEFGTRIGEVFALRDDLLGIWGDPARTGKPTGDDLRNGKATVILGLAGAALVGNQPATEALARIGTSAATEHDVQLLQQALLEAGVRERIEQRITDGIARAAAVLTPGVLTENGIIGLTEMAERVGWRDR